MMTLKKYNPLLRYTQSASTLAYAFSQWLILTKITLSGGFSSVGDLSITQSIAGPAFGLMMFSLRPLWVSKIIKNISFFSIFWIRLFSLLFATFITLLIIILINNSINYHLVTAIIVIKFCEGISDAIYARFDRINLSYKSGILLIIKSLTISLITIISIIINLSLENALILITSIAIISQCTEIFLAHNFNVRKIIIPQKIILPEKYAIRHILITSGNSLIVSILGYLPRYALEVYTSREELGYYTIITIPISIIMMITTGYSQTSLFNISTLIRKKIGIKIVKIISIDALKISCLIAFLYIIIKFIQHYQLQTVFKSTINIPFDGILVAIILSFPICFSQYLSYASLSTARPSWTVGFSLLSFLTQLSIIKMLIFSHQSEGVILTQAIGSIIQSSGFIASIYFFTKIK